MIEEPTELDWALTELDFDDALDSLRRNDAAVQSAAVQSAAVQKIPVRPLATQSQDAATETQTKGPSVCPSSARRISWRAKKGRTPAPK